MDKYTGAQLSTDITKQNIVLFTESVNKVSLTVHGTHYMRWQLPLYCSLFTSEYLLFYISSSVLNWIFKFL